MATPKKLKSGRWSVQVYLGKDKDGKRKYKRISAKSKKECEYLATMVRHDGIAAKKPTVTLREAVEEYIESISNVASPSTLRGYRVILKNYFQELMSVPVEKLTNTIVQQAISEESQRLSPKTIKNGWGLIATSLKKVRGRVFDVRLPQMQIKIKEFPATKEIVDAIKGTPSELPCLLAMWEGLRMGEIKGLDCSSVRDGLLHIEQTRVYKDGQEILKPTAKNDRSIRNVPISSHIMELIENTEAYQNYRLTGENAPLISTPRNRIYKRWKKICKDHNWSMSFHDLRSVNASICIVLGIPDKYTMQRNGYKSDYTLRQRYQNLITPTRQEVDRLIDEYFNSLLG